MTIDAPLKITLGDESSLIEGGNARDLIAAGHGDNTVNAGDGADRITLGDGDNVVDAGAGNDRITVGEGFNRINAGDGNDRVSVGDDNNEIYTGLGNDRITAGHGDNLIFAEAGSNSIFAGNGDNLILAGDGSDKIRLGDGDNEIFAGEGNNRITVGDGENDIGTGSGNDRIRVGDGENVIFAGEGNNRIDAGAGFNEIITGDGDDVIRIRGEVGDIDAGGGNNRITFNSGDIDWEMAGGNDVIRAVNATGFVNLGDGDNRFTARDGEMTVFAGEGQDDIRLSDGDNTVDLGDGNNRVRLGDGDNDVRVDEGDDQIRIGDGDNSILAGDGDDRITAGDGRNVIFAGEGDDVIRVGDGGNIIWAGSGDDKVRGGDGFDIVYLTGLSSDYVVDTSGSTVVVTAKFGDEGSDELRDIDAIAFEGDNVVLNLSEDGAVHLVDDSLESEGEGPFGFSIETLLQNDLNVEVEQNNIEVALQSESGISVSFDGEIVTYNPDAVLDGLKAGEIFTDSFVYTVTDNFGFQRDARVSVSLTGENDAPIATDDRLGGTLIPSDGYEASDTSAIVDGMRSGDRSVTTSKLADGKYVVVWSSHGGDDTSLTGIRAQILAADGSVIIPDFQVNANFDMLQLDPEVSTLASGDFVVAWRSTHRDEPGDSTFNGRIFDASGRAVSEEFPLDDANGKYKYYQEITTLKDGGFVTTWRELDRNPTDYNIKGAVYDNAGRKIVDEFTVNGSLDGSQSISDVKALGGGGFLVTWTHHDSSASIPFAIKGKIYDALGNAVIEDFSISESAESLLTDPVIAAKADGGFAAVWWSQEDGYDYRARVFDANGEPTSPEFQVNDFDLLLAIDAAITWLPDGRLVIAWQENPEGSNRATDFALKARIFEEDGSPFGETFTVSDANTVGSPDIATFDDGSFAITWSEDPNKDGFFEINSKLYAPSGASSETGAVSTTEDEAFEFSISDLLSNDLDVDGDSLAFRLETATSKLGASLNYDEATGQLRYDPTFSNQLQALNNGESAEDHFEYTISDSQGGQDQAVVTLNISGVDDLFG